MKRIFFIIEELEKNQVFLNFFHPSRQTVLEKIADSLTRATFPKPSRQLESWTASRNMGMILVDLHCLFTETNKYLENKKNNILLFPINVTAKTSSEKPFHQIKQSKLGASISAPNLKCLNPT